MTEPSTTAGTANSPASSGKKKLSDRAMAWLNNDRKLSAETLARMPVASGTTFFPEPKAQLEGIFFGYRGGWKARPFPDKTFVAAKGWKPCFWNLEAVLDVLKGGPADVYITEGELDACALVEAGIPEYQVLSVPNGASGAERSAPIEYLIEALEEGLRNASKFIWCGDADEKGLALREQFVNHCGIAKFHYVDWRNERKDANAVLIDDGVDVLQDTLLRDVKPWPTMGVYRLSEMPEPPKLMLWEPELENLRGQMYLAPRTLSVVTGQPGHGKSTFFGQVWFEVIRKYDIAGCFASFETRPKPHIRRQIRTLYIGIPEYQQSPEEMARADRWADDHYLFLNHPEQRPTLDWFLEQCEVAVIRYGVKVCQLDPWNRLEGSRGRDESETEYIGRCLRACHVFAQDMNVHFQILAHPAKLGGDRKGAIPELEDISGSKNWDNMVDQGFVIHRPRLFDEVGKRVTKAKFVVRKARFEELGFPLSVNIDYDLNERRYVADHTSDLVDEP
jgi:twinkle protein